ncbi:zinc ABC transporter substrate-binding protein ZnuA [Oceanisphaera pacifica]|uniref:High-affinity zinc uptake system protein ZnuA n=1 Tax=Oceanisphaera pacifica TaxID=2818389 RepID=A0ABS3NCT1_9GAMM|nr:zinc ABC transporter substrate-binding protein ZnuA [Oceanisphaera pacifica]MBO1518345.1 zinc ABC transporter substrate-binding protein ZnuA [Oceanisphaera pacifica]
MKAFFVFLPLLLLSQSAYAVTVLTSIKPLQLIASAITQGGPAPDLLLSPGNSPHDYALRPSDVRRIKKADLVLWVGPELEASLGSLLAEQPNSLTLMTKITPDEHEHNDEHEAHNTDKIIIEHQDHAHDHSTQDTHLWLDPHHAGTIAQLLADRLIELDPDNIARYQDNLAAFSSQLSETDQQVAAKLAPVADIGYFVFHDAYGYWERHYQLAKLGHFTVNPARAPGAKTVSSIHHALRQSQAQCVFAEPQFKPAVVEAVMRNTQARIGVLDPLASNIEPGPNSYFAFMHELADAMKDCLLNKP